MSNLIQTTRRELGLTGAQLAERIGISAPAVSQMEHSERSGTIQLATLEAALAAMGKSLQQTLITSEMVTANSPERVTQAINEALDEGDSVFALRILTQAVEELRETPISTAQLMSRSSQIKDDKWENLFRAVYGNALPDEQRKYFPKPKKLSRRWYISEFEPLREKAKKTTPDYLRRLNIFIDEKSLMRA